MPLVGPGEQATEHPTKALEERKRTRAVGDHERSVEIKLPERLQLLIERLTKESSGSTDASPGT